MPAAMEYFGVDEHPGYVGNKHYYFLVCGTRLPFNYEYLVYIQQSSNGCGCNKLLQERRHLDFAHM